MATTIPPVHNYESQIVFSNQSNNIKSTDVINWTIAPSGDDVYFNLYKSRMTTTNHRSCSVISPITSSLPM